MKAAVVVFPGSNRERDVGRALRDVTGHEPHYAWHADPVLPAGIDLVIVPGVAFTADGRRLGHGKGYYDRFLVGTTAHTVGACFAEQLVDELPVEPHDVRLDRVLSC